MYVHDGAILGNAFAALFVVGVVIICYDKKYIFWSSSLVPGTELLKSLLKCPK